MAYSITSANAVFILTVPGVYSSGRQLQEFAVDDAFTTEAVDADETQVGVDGYGVAGYVPRAPVMSIRLLASARASFEIFENWIAAQDALQDVLFASAVIRMPSISRSYTCYRGSLTRASSMADVRRVLGPREFGIRWLPTGTIPAISSAPL